MAKLILLACLVAVALGEPNIHLKETFEGRHVSAIIIIRDLDIALKFK